MASWAGLTVLVGAALLLAGCGAEGKDCAAVLCPAVKCPYGSYVPEGECCPVCYQGCKTTCGKDVAHGWSGNDDGSNHCNRCKCSNGAMGCTKMACEPKPCEEMKSCKKSCGEVVPHGWSGKDDGSNHCNSCMCRNGMMMCTMIACQPKPCEKECVGCTGGRPSCIAETCQTWYDGCNTCTAKGCTERFCLRCGEPKCLDDGVCSPYTEEKPCIALEGWCYNAGECRCGEYPQVKCLADPCMGQPCKAGYECVANYCGGCNHMCVPAKDKCGGCKAGSTCQLCWGSWACIPNGAVC